MISKEEFYYKYIKIDGKSPERRDVDIDFFKHLKEIEKEGKPVIILDKLKR